MFVHFSTASNATKCYGMYGCFGIGEPWTTRHRPVSYFPNDLEQVIFKIIKMNNNAFY